MGYQRFYRDFSVAKLPSHGTLPDEHLTAFIIRNSCITVECKRRRAASDVLFLLAVMTPANKREIHLLTLLAWCIMKSSAFPLHHICLSLTLILLVKLTPTARASDTNAVISLLSPFPDTVAIGKNPKVSFRSSLPLLAEGKLILLDGSDVTGLVTEQNGIFTFTPLTPLPPGEHSLYIGAYAEDGTPVEQEFYFATRHSESFEEISSDNRLSVTIKSGLNRDFSTAADGTSGFLGDNYAYRSIDSLLTSESRLKEGPWDTAAKAQVRYYDQSAALLKPERKEFSVIDYLISSTYTEDNRSGLIEFGDTSISESTNTVDYLTRRGLKTSYTISDLTIGGFGVLGKETGYKIDGAGLGFNSKDHIMGLSTQYDFFDRKLSLKAIHVTGGVDEDSIGSWSSSGGVKGNVTGVVLTSDFFEQRLLTDFEFDAVNYDNDTTDGDSDVSDNAYRIRISGLIEEYDYDLSYKYTGPQYDVVGNQSIVKDWAGFSFSGGATYTEHAVRLLLDYSWDNTEDDDLIARIYSFTSGLDYQFSGWEHVPVSLIIEHNAQRSDDEPAGSTETELDTDTVTAGIGYLNGSWSIDLKTTYSFQNDRTTSGFDTELLTVSLLPTYTGTALSVLPSWTINTSKDLSTDVITTTNTLTLDIYTSFLNDQMSCEAGGTYDWTEADDNSIETNNTTAYVKLGYTFDTLFNLEDPKLALEYQYTRQEDETFDTTIREGILTLVLSTTIPYSY